MRLARSEHLLRYNKIDIKVEYSVQELMQKREKYLKGSTSSVREFVYNKRDWPLIASSEHCALPVFSQYTSDAYNDFVCPNAADLALALPGAYFPNETKFAPLVVPPVWHTRGEKCVWHGSFTGVGTTPDENMRMRFAELAAQRPDLFKAGVVSLGHKRVKRKKDGRLDKVNPRLFRHVDVGPHNYKSIQDQALSAKYTACLDGNSGCNRLTSLFAAGFCTIIPSTPLFPQPESFYLAAQSDAYISCKSDLSDLVKTVETLRDDDKRAQTISVNARTFFERNYELDCILSRWKTSLLTQTASLLSDGECKEALTFLFNEKRSCVYCLIDTQTRKLLMFSPLVNKHFINRWQQPLSFACPPRLVFRERDCIQDTRKWWDNGPALICNVQPPNFFSTSMLPRFMYMTQQALTLDF